MILDDITIHPWFLNNPAIKPVTITKTIADRPTKLELDKEIKKDDYAIISKPSIKNVHETESIAAGENEKKET